MSEEHLHEDPELEQDNDLDEEEGPEGDELKAKLAEDLGLDPEDEDDAKILDNAFKRETKQREITSKAIQQKKKYRELYQKVSSKKDGKKPEGNAPDGDEDFDTRVEKKTLEVLEQRDLKALGLSEELEDEVKTLAKLKNISVLEASKLPYIQNRKEEIEREARLSEASPSGKSKGKVNKNLDPNTPPVRGDYSSDKEGSEAYRKDMDAYHKRQQEKNQS